MTKNEILKKIGIILIELREQYDLIQLNRDDINDIDLELFVANSHFLTDHVEILRKLNSREAKPVKQLPPEPKYFEPVVKPTLPEKKLPVFDFTGDKEEETIEPQKQPEQQIEEVQEVPVPEPLIRHELLLDGSLAAENDVDDDDQWASEEEMEKEITEQLLEPYVEQTWPEEEPVEEPISEAPAEHVIADPEPEPEQVPEPEIEYTEPAEVPVAETFIQPEIITPEPEVVIPEPEPEIEYIEPTAEVVEEPIAEAPAEPQFIEPEVIEPEPEIVKAPIVIEDTEEKPSPTIHDILSAQTSSQRFGREVKPITDIKSAVTLNDKLLFVRDLFNGYSMAYGEAVEILNRFSRFEEADNFLKINYYIKNNWEAKQATTDKFYEVLHRRFPE